MTSPIKTPNKITIHQNPQAGVTLMLSVLVLAAITAIAFSLAAIVLVEIRASGDVLRTEPALYAVQGVTEEAFYATTRNIANFSFSNSINGVSLATARRDYDVSPQSYVVYYNALTRFPLADPDQATLFQNNYTSVTIRNINPAAGTKVTVAVFQFQDNGQFGQVDLRDLDTTSPSWTINFSNYPNHANSQFELQLTTTATGNSTVVISSVRNRSGTPSAGLPLTGRTSYDVTASYLGLTRKYNVNISLASGNPVSPVTWTNAAGVAGYDNSLIKSVGTAWGNSGAVSNESIIAGTGYVESIAAETNTHRMFGLSNGDADQNFTDIDYALYMAGGAVQIYEKGTLRGTFGSFVTGDVFRVAVQNNVVTYLKNGTVLYTSTFAPTYPLLVDTALYTPGATINSVLISGN